MNERMEITKKNSASNAVTHGLYARNLILSWESENEYRSLLNYYTSQFTPSTPLEQYYLNELVSTIWRKQRVKRAERKISEGEYNTEKLEELEQNLIEYKKLLEFAEYEPDIEKLKSKIPENILKSAGYSFYSINSIVSYFKIAIKDIDSKILKQLKSNEEAISGESFLNNQIQEKITKYEASLDRKIERIITVLYRLKDMVF